MLRCKRRVVPKPWPGRAKLPESEPRLFSCGAEMFRRNEGERPLCRNIEHVKRRR